MFFTQQLNARSRSMIENIWINVKKHPMYAAYDIEMDSVQYANFGAIAIKINQYGIVKNMFLFYPALDNSGNIGSIAIYGVALDGHKQAIERSMQVFGLPVDSIEWDEGYEKFLDITLADY